MSWLELLRYLKHRFLLKSSNWLVLTVFPKIFIIDYSRSYSCFFQLIIVVNIYTSIFLYFRLFRFGVCDIAFRFLYTNLKQKEWSLKTVYLDGDFL